MACPTTLPTKADLEKLKRQSEFIATVGTGRNAAGATVETVTNPDTGVAVPTVPYAVDQIGGLIVFDFATGGTLNLRREFVQDASLDVWQWTGALPHVVAPGTDPTTDSNWVKVFLGSASEVPKNGGGSVQDFIDESVNTLYVNDLSSINLRNKKIVITGDSLSFNAYDFPIPLNPTDYADGDNSPGLMSWAHMLRDKINRSDDNFIHAFDIGACVSDGTGSYQYNFSTDTDRYFFPQNGSLLEVNGKLSTDTVRLTIPRNYNDSTIRLNCVSAGASLASKDGLVDIYVYTTTGTWINKGTIRTGGRTKYFGLEPFTYDIGDSFFNDMPIFIELRNFRKADGSAPDPVGVSLFISSAQSNTTTTLLTGRGGYTTAQILDDIERLAVSRLPDLMFIIAGANDRANGVSSPDVISNLTNIFAAVRAVKPNVKIVFMSTTRASNAGFAPNDIVNGESMSDWLTKIKLAVISQGAEYFDTYKLTSDLDPSIWRFDNIHFNKSGNKFMLDNVCSRFFPSLIDKYPQLSNPAINFQYWGGLTGRNRNQINSGFIEVQFVDATNTYNTTAINDRDGVIFSVSRGSEAYDLIVTTNFNLQKFRLNMSIIAISSFGAVQPIATTASLSGNTARFTLFTLGGTAITDAENDGKKYMIYFN